MTEILKMDMRERKKERAQRELFSASNVSEILAAKKYGERARLSREEKRRGMGLNTVCCTLSCWSQKLEAPAGGSSFGGPVLSFFSHCPVAVLLLPVFATLSPLLRSATAAALQHRKARGPPEAGMCGLTNAPVLGAGEAPLPASPTQSMARRSQGTIAATLPSSLAAEEAARGDFRRVCILASDNTGVR